MLHILYCFLVLEQIPTESQTPAGKRRKLSEWNGMDRKEPECECVVAGSGPDCPGCIGNGFRHTQVRPEWFPTRPGASGMVFLRFLLGSVGFPPFLSRFWPRPEDSAGFALVFIKFS